VNAEELRGIVTYDPETGFFGWVNARHMKKSSDGRGIGSMNANGYRYLSIRGKRYLCHRLAWLFVNGEIDNREIDHINGARSDNRICNLRLATSSENKQNIRKARKGSETGVLGVRVASNTDGRFTAQITVNGKNCHLGNFGTIEEASDAYLKAKAHMHPFQEIIQKSISEPSRLCHGCGGSENKPSISK